MVWLRCSIVLLQFPDDVINTHVIRGEPIAIRRAKLTALLVQCLNDWLSALPTVRGLVPARKKIYICLVWLPIVLDLDVCM